MASFKFKCSSETQKSMNRWPGRLLNTRKFNIWSYFSLYSVITLFICHCSIFLIIGCLNIPFIFHTGRFSNPPKKKKIGSNCNQQSWETIFLVNKIVMKYVFNEPFSKHNTKADINMHSSRQKVFLAGGFFFYQSSLAHKSKFDPVTWLK